MSAQCCFKIMHLAAVLIVVTLICLCIVVFTKYWKRKRNLYKSADVNPNQNMVLIGHYSFFDGLYIYDETNNIYNHEIFNVAAIVNNTNIELVDKARTGTYGNRLIVGPDKHINPGVSVQWLVASTQFTPSLADSMVLSYHGRQDGLYNKDDIHSTSTYNVYKHELLDYWLVQSSIIIQVYTEPQLQNMYTSRIIVDPLSLIAGNKTVKWQPVTAVQPLLRERQMQLIDNTFRYTSGIYVYDSQGRSYVHQNKDAFITQSGISLSFFRESIYIGTEVINDSNKFIKWVPPSTAANVQISSINRMVLTGYDLKYDGLYILDTQGIRPQTIPAIPNSYVHTVYNDRYVTRDGEQLNFYGPPVNQIVNLVSTRKIIAFGEPYVENETVFWESETMPRFSNKFMSMTLAGFDSTKNGIYKYNVNTGLYKHESQSIFVVQTGLKLKFYDNNTFLAVRAITQGIPIDGVSVNWILDHTVAPIENKSAIMQSELNVRNFQNNIPDSAECNGPYIYNKATNRFTHKYKDRLIINSGKSLTCLSLDEQINYGTFKSADVAVVPTL